ncbi:beta-hexosaminidase subunit beta isoform X2 [Rhincodon typus]|uniref:beta-hexosaminidase subunit beta isoform X2 n=1 Tax=Rhincodon typus TaxID=259920 RepID=UPI00202E012B|nr:beta-hexosaminidase subunit beta isoform X2 [Rhincodon typus]
MAVLRGLAMLLPQPGFRFLLAGLLLFLGRGSALSLQEESSPFGSLWPLPQKLNIEAELYRLSPATFQIVHSPQSSASVGCSILDNAFRRYFYYIFGSSTERDQPAAAGGGSGGNVDELSQLQVIITASDPECNQHPSVTSVETYEIVVTQPVAILKSENVWGALRGLETFSQLVYEDQYDTVAERNFMVTEFLVRNWYVVISNMLLAGLHLSQHSLTSQAMLHK